MPFTKKITVSRDGTTAGASGVSNNPPLATLTDNAVDIVWGDSNYAVAADSERVITTRYKFTMPDNLIGVFIPTAPYVSGSAEALIIRPVLIKNGDTLFPTTVNYSASASFNVSAGSLIWRVIFVEGKSVLTT